MIKTVINFLVGLIIIAMIFLILFAVFILLPAMALNAIVAYFGVTFGIYLSTMWIVIVYFIAFILSSIIRSDS